jgi:hypothetical protein
MGVCRLPVYGLSAPSGMALHIRVQTIFFHFNTCTVHFLLFCKSTNKSTITISLEIITPLIIYKFILIVVLLVDLQNKKKYSSILDIIT